MSEWREEVRSRLQRAAWDLCLERGYDQTTAAEIAERAGVAERTFFRYFPDKREVLFDGEVRWREALTIVIAKAPGALGPLETLLLAFKAIEPMFENDRAATEARQAIIDRTPALHERQLAKTASLTKALSVALVDRGLDEGLSMMAAQAGMAAFGHAGTAWLRNPSVSLSDHLDHAFHQLRALSDAARP